MTANGDGKEQSTGKTRRRKGRFRRFLFVLLLLLVALVWSGPYLASTDTARDMIVSAVNERIFGTISIDDLSLSWFGPCRVDGLRVTDTSGREVLEVEQITVSVGAWRGLTGYEDFGRVDLVKPRPKLIFKVEDDGSVSVSIARAIQLRKPSENPPPKPLGRIAIRDGAVDMVLPNGKTGAVSGINGQFHLDTLENITGRISWDSAEIYNLAFGKATFTPTLLNDRLELPVTTIAVSATPKSPLGSEPPDPKPEQPGGLVRVGGAIDFTGPEPVLQIPGRLQVAENVPVNREIGNDLLSRIITIFYEPKRLAGGGSLVVRDINLPLGKSIEHTGSGSGTLVLRDIKIQAGGLLTSLTNLGGLAAPTYPTTMRISDLDFRIRDGWIDYDNLAIIYAETFDTKFSGSVGIVRDHLDLKVSLSMTPMQLDAFSKILSPEKVGAKVGMEDLGRVLGKLPIIGRLPIWGSSRLDIYLTGTRAKPEFDLKRTFEELLKPKTVPTPRPDAPRTPSPDDLLWDLLDDLIKPKPKPPEPESRPKPKDDPKSRPAPKTPDNPLLDILNDLLTKPKDR